MDFVVCFKQLHHSATVPSSSKHPMICAVRAHLESRGCPGVARYAVCVYVKTKEKNCIKCSLAYCAHEDNTLH